MTGQNDVDIPGESTLRTWQQEHATCICVLGRCTYLSALLRVSSTVW